MSPGVATRNVCPWGWGRPRTDHVGGPFPEISGWARLTWILESDLANLSWQIPRILDILSQIGKIFGNFSSVVLFYTRRCRTDTECCSSVGFVLILMLEENVLQNIEEINFYDEKTFSKKIEHFLLRFLRSIFSIEKSSIEKYFGNGFST